MNRFTKSEIAELLVDLLNLLFFFPYVSWVFLLGPPFLVLMGLGYLTNFSIENINFIFLIFTDLLLLWVKFLEERIGIRLTNSGALSLIWMGWTSPTSPSQMGRGAC